MESDAARVSGGELRGDARFLWAGQPRRGISGAARVGTLLIAAAGVRLLLNSHTVGTAVGFAGAGAPGRMTAPGPAPGVTRAITTTRPTHEDSPRPSR
jgi:hypothetical protein